VLQIDVLEVAHKGWGWSSVIPGLGFLKQRFAEPFLFHWELEADVTSLARPGHRSAATLLRHHGRRAGRAGEFRTRPPGIFGGNMDVRELATGATLYLPVQQPGALFSCGDAHAAQGDGEVCINGIECPADVTLRFHLHKQRPRRPARRVRPSDESGPSMARRRVPHRRAHRARSRHRSHGRSARCRWGFEPVHAYLLCSVAMKLQSQPGRQRTHDHRLRRHRQEHPAAALSSFPNPYCWLSLCRSTTPPPSPNSLELYPRYEEALVTNDVETLTAMFWASPYAIRLGAGENLYGVDEIEAFRKSRPAVNLARRMVRLEIVTFGKDFGSITLEFERDTTGGVVRGRQSQVWVRLPEGWRIVSAHVSISKT
jgi:hypothetical protein